MKTTIAENFAKRTGRLIVVNGVQWKWKIGQSNVLAYSEHGERKCAHGAHVKGVTPDEWDRGQWKGTMRLVPSEVSKWLQASIALSYWFVCLIFIVLWVTKGCKV